MSYSKTSTAKNSHEVSEQSLREANREVCRAEDSGRLASREAPGREYSLPETSRLSTRLWLKKGRVKRWNKQEE